VFAGDAEGESFHFRILSCSLSLVKSEQLLLLAMFGPIVGPLLLSFRLFHISQDCLPPGTIRPCRGDGARGEL